MGSLLIIIQGEDCVSLDALKRQETVVEIVVPCTYHLDWTCVDTTMIEVEKEGVERGKGGERREEKEGRRKKGGERREEREGRRKNGGEREREGGEREGRREKGGERERKGGRGRERRREKGEEKWGREGMEKRREYQAEMEETEGDI